MGSAWGSDNMVNYLHSKNSIKSVLANFFYGQSYTKSPILGNSVGNQQRKIGFLSDFLWLHKDDLHSQKYLQLQYNIDLSCLKQKYLTLAQ